MRRANSLGSARTEHRPARIGSVPARIDILARGVKHPAAQLAAVELVAARRETVARGIKHFSARIVIYGRAYRHPPARTGASSRADARTSFSPRDPSSCRAEETSSRAYISLSARMDPPPARIGASCPASCAYVRVAARRTILPRGRDLLPRVRLSLRANRHPRARNGASTPASRAYVFLAARTTVFPRGTISVPREYVSLAARMDTSLRADSITLPRAPPVGSSSPRERAPSRAAPLRRVRLSANS